MKPDLLPELTEATCRELTSFSKAEMDIICPYLRSRLNKSDAAQALKKKIPLDDQIFIFCALLRGGLSGAAKVCGLFNISRAKAVYILDFWLQCCTFYFEMSLCLHFTNMRVKNKHFGQGLFPKATCFIDYVPIKIRDAVGTHQMNVLVVFAKDGTCTYAAGRFEARGLERRNYLRESRLTGLLLPEMQILSRKNLPVKQELASLGVDFRVVKPPHFSKDNKKETWKATLVRKHMKETVGNFLKFKILQEPFFDEDDVDRLFVCCATLYNMKHLGLEANFM